MLRSEVAFGEWMSASVQVLAQFSESARFTPLNGSLFMRMPFSSTKLVRMCLLPSSAKQMPKLV